MSSTPSFERRSERLVLTEVRDSDVDALCEVLGDAESMRHYPAPYSRERVVETIERAQRSQAERGHCKWALRLIDTGELIGLTGLVSQIVDDREQIEVGWNLHPAHQGKGFATEAGARAIRFGFDELGLDRIVSLIVPANAPSQRVSERLGMQITGTTMFGPGDGVLVDVWSIDRGRDRLSAQPSRGATMSTDTAEFAKETGTDGSFQRQTSAFRNEVTADGSGDFPAVAGRYHLYVSKACPWAHRAIIVRRLKGLEDAIGMTVVDPIRDDKGWRFGDHDPANGEVDPVNGWSYLSEGYLATDPTFDGRVTVPTLWDTERGVVVNNESSEVIRILNSAFNEFARNPELDLYPADLRSEIDSVNDWIYNDINNGVYRCGFATTQSAYEDSYERLFLALDRLETLLGERRYVAGDRITEADWRLWTTLVRFDAVYVGHFKCNRNRIIDLPNTWAYARELYQQPGIADTVDFDHIKRHYYVTHAKINPTMIVPAGPAINWDAPHLRGN